MLYLPTFTRSRYSNARDSREGPPEGGSGDDDDDDDDDEEEDDDEEDDDDALFTNGSQPFP